MPMALDGAAKAELHLHFQGAIRPSTLLELARRNSITLPAESLEGLREWFVFRDFITQVAIDGRFDGVVALGLAGTENGYPPEPFAPWFAQARAAGLHSAPHAGELAGPESIWGALRALGAERIGHGVRAIEDPAL